MKCAICKEKGLTLDQEGLCHRCWTDNRAIIEECEHTDRCPQAFDRMAECSC